MGAVINEVKRVAINDGENLYDHPAPKRIVKGISWGCIARWNSQKSTRIGGA